jgi:hypothetical protein
MASTGHTIKAFDQELDALRATISEMGGLAEAAIRESMDALVKRDAAAAARVIERDARIDALEAEVERNAPVVDLTIPAFCVTEVSEDDRFRNEYLAHHPFGDWAAGYRKELSQTGPRFVDNLGINEVEGSQPRL